MRIVVQRVTEASVTVAQNQIARIGKGFLLLVGIEQGDTLSLAHKFADKITKLRVFSDQNDKMNLALADVAGQILSVSQFTLLADTSMVTGRVSHKQCGPSLQNRYLSNSMTDCVPTVFWFKPVNLARICRLTCTTTDR